MTGFRPFSTRHRRARPVSEACLADPGQAQVAGRRLIQRKRNDGYPGISRKGTILGYLPGWVPILFLGSQRLPEKVLRSLGVHQLQSCRFPYFRRVTLAAADIAGADENDLFAPEPATLTGALIGYVRMSRPGQILDRQALP
jgi:hypothetical protein